MKKLTVVQRRALEAISNGHGRCGLSNASGYLLDGSVRRDVIIRLRDAELVCRGRKVRGSDYAYMLVLTDAGREALR